MFPLGPHTIFVTLAGSQAHGTARPGSDVDLRGVCVAPLSVRLSLFEDFAQYEGEVPDALARSIVPRLEAHPTASRALDLKTECVIFDVSKFVRLCAAANPNALEVLFADPRDWVYVTPAWRHLHDARRQFLTQKVQQTFLGYAMAQLKKIETHRAWLLHPPRKKPSREDFDLPAASATLSRDDQNRIERSIADKIRSYGIDDIDMPRATRIALQERLAALFRDALSASDDDLDARMRAVATRGLRLPPEVVAALNAEKKYRSAMKQWDAYQAWKAHRNPARAALERQHGYDTKHAMHLIRLLRMGLEILETGELRVRRDDAGELSAIRDGAWAFDALHEHAAALRHRMKAAARTSSLPADIDMAGVDSLVEGIMVHPVGPPTSERRHDVVP